jgi:HSP20 family protein
MDRLLQESEQESAPAEREMFLATDVCSEDDDFVITAMVPGLEADDVNIEILNNTVSIRGEFQFPQPENAKYLMNELPAGRFSRVITLPTAVDAAKVQANMRNGVLTLRVPKAEAHRPKAIKVNAN